MNHLNNLRVRLVLWTVMLEAVLLLIFAFIFVTALQSSQNQQIDETLRLSAAQMNAVVDVAVSGGGSRYEIPAEDTAALRTRGVLVWILAPDGRVGATVGEAAFSPLPRFLPALGDTVDIILANGEPARLLTLPLQEGNRLYGTLVLAVSYRTGQTFIQQVLLSLVIALPVVLSLSAAGGLFLANRALLPVATITATAREISAADLSQRLALNLPDDEIGRLAQTFNGMLERLDHAFQRERQLTSDVSHELRTPLGMLKTQLSLARSRPRTHAELLQMMVAMEGDVDRMTRLVEQMLTLARIEQHGIDTFSPIDVGLLLTEIMENLEPKAQDKSISMSLSIPHTVSLVLDGDQDHLRQVFTNLVENGIKYADVGGKVDVQVRRLYEQLVVTVSNTGPGIHPDDLPHIFERFYRADVSRARSTGGFGLGLAISKAIVEAHQGRITVASNAEGETSFAVVLLAETTFPT